MEVVRPVTETTNEIPTVSFIDYSAQIEKDRTLVNFDAETLKKIEAENKEHEKKLESISHKNYIKLLNDLADNGVYEKADFFPYSPDTNGEQDSEIKEYEFQSYFALRKAGYEVYTPAIYDDSGEMIGWQSYKVKPATLEEKSELVAVGNKIIEDSDKVIYEQQGAIEKERNNELQKRVQQGETTYLGELTIDEYIDLLNRAPELHKKGVFSTVTVFDEQGAKVYGKKKYYVLRGK